MTHAATRERIVSLALARVPPREIAERLALAPEDVHSAISYARRKGVDIPRFVGGPRAGHAAPRSRGVRIPATHYHVLHDEARRRGLPGPGALVHALLGAICTDRLFDAILSEDEE